MPGWALNIFQSTNKRLIFLPAGDQNYRDSSLRVTTVWHGSDKQTQKWGLGQFWSWLLGRYERERILPVIVIVIIQRIISNLNSKDKVDLMIFNFWDSESVLLKFIRESDWGCLCDGGYLLSRTNWNVVGDIRYGARAWKISQTASNIILQ